MPTVPVLIFRLSSSGSSGATGWRFRSNILEPADVCRALSSTQLNWTRGGDASGLSISPTGEPSYDSGNLAPQYTTGTITYADSEMARVFADYYTDTTTLNYAAQRGFGYEMVFPFGSISASVDNPLSESATVTLTVEVLSHYTTINGVEVYRHFDRARVRVGGVSGTVYTPTLTPAGAENTVATGVFTNSDTSSIDTIVTKTCAYACTVEFPLADYPVEISLGTAYGEWLKYQTLKWVPAGSFTIAVEDDEATLDATGVYVVGSVIQAATGFRYTFDDTGISQPFFTDEDISTHSINGHSLNDGELLIAYLRATSQAGCVTDFTASVAVEDTNTVHGMSDNDGVGYETVKEGANLVTYQHPDVYANRVLKSTLENHDNPTLYQIPGSSRFFLAARDKATNSYTTYYSDDNCESFEVVT